MDLVTSETAARMMPGDESISGMADPSQEGISTSSSSSSTTNVIWTIGQKSEIQFL